MKRIVLSMIILLCGMLMLSSCNKTKKDIKSDYETIDIDLSSMSSTVVYAQVSDMLTNSLQYEGKVIRMSGRFSAYYSADTKTFYPSVIIKDATACCEQGLEFLIKGNPLYPTGYPKEGTNITVDGVFRIYYENGRKYVHLVDSIIVA